MPTEQENFMAQALELAADESVYEQLVELAMNADATINILYSAGHPTNEYIYTCDDAALCLDISPT